MKPLALLSITTLAVLAQHQQDDDKMKRNPAIGNTVAIAEGERTFNAGCAGCHGPGGQGGRGPNLAFGRVMWHTLTDEQTFKLIRDGVANAGMPATPGSDEKIWQLTAYVRSLREPAAEAPLTGDAAIGERIFKSKCTGCHAIRGEGGKLGPDLSNVGGTRPAGYIRLAIMEPGANGSKGYEKTAVTLKSGKKLDGVLRNRNNYSLQLQDAKGDLHLLLVKDVAELRISPDSAMPAIGKTLSAAEVDGLVAFLGKQSVRPVEAGNK